MIRNRAAAARTPNQVTHFTAGQGVARLPAHSPSLYLVRHARRTELSVRGKQMEAVIGKPAQDVSPVRNALFTLSDLSWNSFILPLINTHYPRLLTDEPAMTKLHSKLKYLTSRLYAPGCYAMLFSAKTRPLMVRSLIWIGNHTPGFLKKFAIKGAEIAFRNFRGGHLQDLHHAIALSAATVAVFDEAFDSLGLPPDERAAHCKAVMRGQDAPSTPALKLLRALFAEAERVAEKRGPQFVRYFHEHVVPSGDRYCDMEAKAFGRKKDPDGTAFRAGGTEATIILFMLAIDPAMSEQAQKVFFDFSTIVQMVDDWVDFEGDAQEFRAGGRPTPVLNGKWDFEQIRAFYQQTMERYGVILKQSGIRGTVITQICVAGMQDLLRQMLDAMDLGIAN